LKNLKKEPNIGLSNIGDTSYLNAVLRYLGHIEIFALFFLDDKVKESSKI
jgi:ubiquitin C-terminal hydrolase